MRKKCQTIAKELKRHAPFTAFGTLTGIIIMALVFHLQLRPDVSRQLFWFFHPIHVLASAWATTAMYRLHAKKSWLRLLLIGYLGSIGIATLSDSVIPYLGELLLGLPNRGFHFGAIEKWWLVNPLALTGILLGGFLPATKIPHASHVLLSTWASLFHMIMAAGGSFDVMMVVLASVFMFLAVWLPCCTSDIVFPLLWTSQERKEKGT
ncbi:MAG: hypothetical protein JW797_14580 [Bradymonadales bacterium]|nr:hypothetical protein [Bradymonadales bacterium]